MRFVLFNKNNNKKKWHIFFSYIATNKQIVITYIGCANGVDGLVSHPPKQNKNNIFADADISTFEITSSVLCYRSARNRFDLLDEFGTPPTSYSQWRCYIHPKYYCNCHLILMILKLRLISTIISMIQCIVTDRVATIIPFIKTSQNYINKVMRIFSLIEIDKKIKRFYLLSFLYAFTRQVMRVFSIHTLVTPNQLNAAHSNV